MLILAARGFRHQASAETGFRDRRLGAMVSCACAVSGGLPKAEETPDNP
jgi:hypothetical protein